MAEMLVSLKESSKVAKKEINLAPLLAGVDLNFRQLVVRMECLMVEMMIVQFQPKVEKLD